MHKVLCCLLALSALPAQAETLRFFPPAGFAGVHVSDSGVAKLTEFVREGSTLEAWTEALTVAELRDTGMGAEAFVAALTERSHAGCREAFEMSPEVLDINGRTATMSIHACPNLNVSGRPEMGLLRVIEGRDGTLFAIQRSWINPPERADLDEWTDWLRALQVCDADGCS